MYLEGKVEGRRWRDYNGRRRERQKLRKSSKQKTERHLWLRDRDESDGNRLKREQRRDERERERERREQESERKPERLRQKTEEGINILISRIFLTVCDRQQ